MNVTAPGPSCTPAAPKASEVCSGCRPCTPVPAGDTAPDLDVEPPHDGLDDRQVFLVLGPRRE